MTLLVVIAIVVGVVVMIAAQARKRRGGHDSEFAPDVLLSAKLARRRIEQVCRRSEHVQARHLEVLKEAMEIGTETFIESLEKKLLWISLVAPFIPAKQKQLEDMVDQLAKDAFPDEAKLSSALRPTEEIDMEVERKVIDALAKAQGVLRQANLTLAAIPTADDRTVSMIDDVEGGVTALGLFAACRAITVECCLEVAAGTSEAHFPGGMSPPVAKAAFSLMMGLKLEEGQSSGIAREAEKVRRVFYDQQPLKTLQANVEERVKERITGGLEELQTVAVQARIAARNHWVPTVDRWERETLRNLDTSS